MNLLEEGVYIDEVSLYLAQRLKPTKSPKKGPRPRNLRYPVQAMALQSFHACHTTLTLASQVRLLRHTSHSLKARIFIRIRSACVSFFRVSGVYTRKMWIRQRLHLRLDLALVPSTPNLPK